MSIRRIFSSRPILPAQALNPVSPALLSLQTKKLPDSLAVASITMRASGRIHVGHWVVKFVMRIRQQTRFCESVKVFMLRPLQMEPDAAAFCGNKSSQSSRKYENLLLEPL